MTLIFNPGVSPQFIPEDEEETPRQRTPSIKSYMTEIPRTLRPLTTYRLPYRGLTLDQRDYFKSFFHEVQSTTGDFKYQYVDPVHSPRHRGPDLTSVVKAGAPAGSRNYQVQFTWYDSTVGQETKASPISSITIAGGSVVHVKVPFFPLGVPSFRVYAGQVGQSLWSQGYATSRDWEAGTAELLTMTSLAPASNNLKPLVLCQLAANLIYRKATVNRWDVDLTLQVIHV